MVNSCNASNLRIDGTIITLDILGYGRMSADYSKWESLVEKIGGSERIKDATFIAPYSIDWEYCDVQTDTVDFLKLAKEQTIAYWQSRIDEANACTLKYDSCISNLLNNPDLWLHKANLDQRQQFAKALDSHAFRQLLYDFYSSRDDIEASDTNRGKATRTIKLGNQVVLLSDPEKSVEFFGTFIFRVLRRKGVALSKLIVWRSSRELLVDEVHKSEENFFDSLFRTRDGIVTIDERCLPADSSYWTKRFEFAKAQGFFCVAFDSKIDDHIKINSLDDFSAFARSVWGVDGTSRFKFLLTKDEVYTQAIDPVEN